MPSRFRGKPTNLRLGLRQTDDNPEIPQVVHVVVMPDETEIIIHPIMFGDSVTAPTTTSLVLQQRLRTCDAGHPTGDRLSKD